MRAVSGFTSTRSDAAEGDISTKRNGKDRQNDSRKVTDERMKKLSVPAAIRCMPSIRLNKSGPERHG